VKTPSYLQPTASTAQRVASTAATKRVRPPPRRDPPHSRALLSSGDDPSSKGESKPSAPKSRAVSRDGAIDRVDPVSTHRLSFKTEEPTAQPSHPEGPSVPQVPPRETLEVAAQVQSWLFMRSNLQDCLSVVRQGAQVHYLMGFSVPSSLTFVG
jgi:hypothetical protein